MSHPLKLTDAEMARLTRDLAAMLAAGWTLPHLLQTMAKQADDPRIANAFAAVSADLEKKIPLEKAVLEHQAVFGHFFCKAVGICGSAGTLPKLIGLLPEYYEKNARFSDLIRRKLRFPFLMGVASISIVLTMLAFFSPQAARLVASIHGKLPPLTEAVLSAGNFFRNGQVMAATVVMLVLLAAAPLMLLWKKFDPALLLAERIGISFSRRIVLRSFFNSCSILLQSGAGFPEALDLSLESIRGSSLFNRLAPLFPSKNFQTISSFSQELKSTGILSKPVLDLFEEASKKQNGGELFKKFVEFLQEEVENGVTVFALLVVPAIIAISGLLGLGLLLSLYLPLRHIAGIH